MTDKGHIDVPVPRGRWIRTNPMYSFEFPAALPPCVYVVFGDGRPLYVGQTMNLRARFRDHALRYSYDNRVITPWDVPRPKDAWLKVRFSVAWGDWLMWEARLIRKLQPVGNIRGISTTRCAA